MNRVFRCRVRMGTGTRAHEKAGPSRRKARPFSAVWPLRTVARPGSGLGRGGRSGGSLGRHALGDHARARAATARATTAAARAAAGAAAGAAAATAGPTAATPGAAAASPLAATARLGGAAAGTVVAAAGGTAGRAGVAGRLTAATPQEAAGGRGRVGGHEADDDEREQHRKDRETLHENLQERNRTLVAPVQPSRTEHRSGTATGPQHTEVSNQPAAAVGTPDSLGWRHNVAIGLKMRLAEIWRENYQSRPDCQ